MIKTLKDLVEYVSICPCCKKNIKLDYETIISKNRHNFYFKNGLYGLCDNYKIYYYNDFIYNNVFLQFNLEENNISNLIANKIIHTYEGLFIDSIDNDYEKYCTSSLCSNSIQCDNCFYYILFEFIFNPKDKKISQFEISHESIKTNEGIFVNIYSKNISRLYFEGGKCVDFPLLSKDFSNIDYVLKRVKKLILFS